MRHHTGHQQRFPADDAERASIRALKNWLLASPGENPLDDQIVRLRLAAAIARLSSRPGASKKEPVQKTVAHAFRVGRAAKA